MYQNHDSTTLLPCRVFKAHKDYLTRLLLSPDIKLLATCSADHTVRIWKIDMNEENLEVLPESQTVGGTANGTGHSDPNTPSQPLFPQSQTPLNGVHSSNGALQSNGNTGGSTPNPEPFTTSTTTSTSHSTSSLPPSSSSSTQFQSQQNAFRSVSKIVSSRRPLPCDVVLDNHQRWVWDCAFSADSAYLVTVCSDHYARLWELGTASIIRQYNGHHRGAVCVALNDYSNPA